MSSLMSTILQVTEPNYWEKADYTHARFKSFPLSRFSHEYTTIETEFINKFGSRYNITEISRIQHPYAYTSCQIRRKQLSIINGTSIPAENRRYFCLANVDQVVEFLEYNCDERKGTAYSSHVIPSGCVVMAKEIAGSSYKSRSSNGYPDYLIKYKPSTDVDGIGRLLGRLELR